MKTFLALIGLFHLAFFLLGMLGLVDYKVTITAPESDEEERQASDETSK